MKRLATLVLALAIALSACSLALADDKVPSEEKPASVDLDYSYTGTVDVAPYVEKFEQQFEENYGVKVNVNIVTSGFEDIDVIKTAVASGSGPDVWHMDVNYLSAFKGNVIQPISPYLDDSIFGEYLENGIAPWKDGDDVYALPVSFSVVGFLYNKDAVQAAGVTLGDKWTFEEFENALATCYDYYKDKTVKYSDGNEYPYYMLSTHHTMYYWWLFLGVYGGKPMCQTNNFAQEAYVNAITKMAEWRSKGYLHYSAEVGPVGTSTAFANCGNIVFWPTGDWSITTLTRLEKGIESEAMDLVVDYASIPSPTGADGKSYTEIYNQGVVLNKNTTGWAAKAGAELIKSLCYDDDNWMALFGPGAYNYCMPGKTKWAEEYKGWVAQEENAQGFLDTVANGVCYSPDYNNNSIDVTTMITSVIMDAFNYVDEAGTFDETAVRALVTEKLEAQQALYNLQLEENDVELDNPSGKVQ